MKRKDRRPELQFYEWSVLRWFPSDARNSLDATGRGIYREMLDACYAQGSIASDPAAIARRCACTPDELSSRWSIIEPHFYQDKHDPARLRNKDADIFRKSYFTFRKKQKSNREKGQKTVPEKSNGDTELGDSGQTKPQPEVASGPTKTRLDETRREETPQTPLESEGDPDMVIRSKPAFYSDETLTPLRELFDRAHYPGIDEDWTEAHTFAWRTLDWEQKQQRITAAKARIDAGFWDDPKFIPKPLKFVQQEWKRPLPAAPKKSAEKNTSSLLPLM